MDGNREGIRMNEQLLALALECDLLDSRDDLDHPAFVEIIVSIEAFYHLAVAAEREACARVVENTRWSNWFQSDCASAIRERSQS